jgi:PAS domain S-box-containing protein
LDDTAVSVRAIDTSLEDFFENGAVGLHIVAGDGTILRANRAELSLLGYRAEEYIGRQISDFHADEDTICDILGRLGRGETIDRYPARLRAKDGSIRHVEITSSVCFDDGGNFKNTRCFTVDVTDRRQAEAELQEAQQRLSATYEHALVGISELDAQGRYLRTNDGLTHLTGYSKTELIGVSCFAITHPDDAAQDREDYRRQVQGEIDRYTVEKRYIRANGSPVWVSVLSSTVRAVDGSFLYAVRVAHDISERKAAEERQRVLINELNHRVKNTLATVQSFARQTARHARDVGDFMARFEGRLIALSMAHDRLTRRNWEDASLAEIVAEELALHGGERRGLFAEGPDLALPPRTALALSMALHELGTNAVKYGALTSPEGRIAVRWTAARDNHSRPREVSLVWEEAGGPPVAAPTTTGFGSRLLQAMAAEIGGRGQLTFAPAGVRWELDFPLRDAEGDEARPLAISDPG